MNANKPDGREDNISKLPDEVVFDLSRLFEEERIRRQYGSDTYTGRILVEQNSTWSLIKSPNTSKILVALLDHSYRYIIKRNV